MKIKYFYIVLDVFVVYLNKHLDNDGIPKKIA